MNFLVGSSFDDVTDMEEVVSIVGALFSLLSLTFFYNNPITGIYRNWKFLNQKLHTSFSPSRRIIPPIFPFFSPAETSTFGLVRERYGIFFDPRHR